MIDNVLEGMRSYKKRDEVKASLLLAKAISQSVRRVKKMNTIFEAEKLLEKLFLCTDPFHSPQGKKIFNRMSDDELEKRFN